MLDVCLLCDYKNTFNNNSNASLVVLKETDGDGVGRILEASGNTYLLNNCFKLLRYDGVIFFFHLLTRL